jgi:hypothetical protein
VQCVSLAGEWAGTCANCKFKDWAKKCSLNDGSGPDRYRTTPAGGSAGDALAAPSLSPPILPYEIEEPESEEEEEEVPVVRQITDGREAS